MVDMVVLRKPLFGPGPWAGPGGRIGRRAGTRGWVDWRGGCEWGRLRGVRFERRKNPGIDQFKEEEG